MVKESTKYEEGVLTKLTDLRTQFLNANSVEEKIEISNELQHQLKSVFAMAENYPDLKANQNFLQLQGEISDIENKLAATRRFFNSTTRELNTSVQSFPSNLIANMFGFHKEPMFEIPQEDRATLDKASEIKF